MATTKRSPPGGSRSPRFEYALQGRKRSAYERAASMVLALLLLIGLIVLILLITWLTMQIFVKQTAVPVELEEIGAGEGPSGGGSGQELEPPPPEEVPFEPPVDDPLMLIDEIIADRAPELTDPLFAQKKPTGFGRGEGTGIGDGKGPGRGGRPRNWEVLFPAGNTLQTYAKQLDFFKIELGVLMPDNKVIYAYNFSKPKPDARTGTVDAEKRYYLTWRRGRDKLAAADRELLARAGVPTEGRIILKFLPPPLEAQLLALEKARAKERAQTKVRKTVFQLRSEPNGYAFYVAEQTYD